MVRFIGDTRGLDEIKNKFNSLGQQMAAVGGIAAAAFAGKAIKSASDFGETASKVGQIFGQQAGQINKFAENAAKGLGQSQQSALDAAATFGVFAKSAGLGGDSAAQFAIQMTGLATDLASFNNTSPEQAIEALGAALRGEAEPIRAYGVLLDDATLRNRAMAMGIINTTSQALTPQQRVLAAQQEILAQTSMQQGDFARTQGSLANQTRILKAEFENFTVQIGMFLVPILQWALNLFNEHRNVIIGIGIVLGALTLAFGVHTVVTRTLAIAHDIAALATWAHNSSIVASTFSFIGSTAAAVGHTVALGASRLALLAATAAQWLLNAAMNANPIMWVVGLIGLLVGAFITAWQHSETFRNIITNAWTGVRNAAMTAWNWMNDHVFRPLGQAWDAIPEIAGRAIGRIVDVLKAPVNAVIGFINDRILGPINSVTSVFGLNIGRIPMLASGGPIPVGSGFWTNGPMAVVGEGNPNYPELVIPTDPKYRNNAAALWMAAGHRMQFLAGGGVIGAISDFFGKVMDAGRGIAADGLEKLLRPVVNAAGSIMPDTQFFRAIRGIIGAILDRVVGWVRGKTPEISANVGGSGVQRWAGLVLQVLAMLGQSPALLPNVLRRMNQESGGNPLAVNNWDINAQRGTPSMGLMQTIGPTFNAYAGPFRGLGIFNPLANIYAGLNYAIHRYGSLQYAMDKPGGYRHGGWLMPGDLAFNETREPEAILNKRQWNALERGSGKTVINNWNITTMKVDRADIRRYLQEEEALNASF
ncbi:transglycosylase SLT domain-containing protein [Amycolatopsis thermoflava]|uniref:transglycosylase SLT domain-containing protein n=1 Tax=Amycolatopsis thermoflava TaxID=84480 RepID=UPI003EC0AA81